MPISYTSVRTVEWVEEYATCNKCGKLMMPDDPDNPFEYQEMFTWQTTGGYSSVWGDGNTVRVTLCQHCAYNLLEPYTDDNAVEMNGK